MKKIDFGYLGTQEQQKERKIRSQVIYRAAATSGMFWLLYLLIEFLMAIKPFY